MSGGNNGVNRSLEDRLRMAFAGLGEILGGLGKDGRQHTGQPPPPFSILRGPQRHRAAVAVATVTGGGTASIGRILEDLVHFNNNLTPTANDPAIWWRPPPDPSDFAVTDADNAAASGDREAAAIGCVTFGELNERANFLARCLARALRSHGVPGPLTLCAIMPCCPDRLALELGAMKLGVPVLSLEPDRCDPCQALAAVRPACVVVSGGARLMDAAAGPALVLQFEDLAEAGRALGLSKRDIQEEETGALVGEAGGIGDPVAFVVETAGGRFVSLTQGDLLAAVAWLWDALPWQCHEVLWMGDSCDSVYWRVHALSALLHGIPIVMCARCPRWEPWLAMMRAHYTTRLVTSPTFLSDLLAHTADHPDARARLQSVETVLTLGEPLLASTAQEFFRQLGSGKTLGSVYGCAETCGAAAYTLLRCPADVQEATLPEGGGITLQEVAPNLCLAVTDARGRPLPEGDVGEVRLLFGTSNTAEAWDGAAAMRTGDAGLVLGGRLACYGRIAGTAAPRRPTLLTAEQLAGQLERQGFGRLHVTPGNRGSAAPKLLVHQRRPQRRFTTAPLRRLAASASIQEVGALPAWAEMPRQRLWELPDPVRVLRPATAADNDDADDDSWTEAARRLAESAMAAAAMSPPGSSCGHLGRLLLCPKPQVAAAAAGRAGPACWESHLPDTEAQYRLEGPDEAGATPLGAATAFSFRLVDSAGRIAALAEFQRASAADVVASVAAAGFDASTSAASLAGAEAVMRVSRVRFPRQTAGSVASGGGLGFLRLADLVENLLLHCAQLLACDVAVRVADDTITQLLCQDLDYTVATSQPSPSFPADVFRRESNRNSSGSSRCSSRASSSGCGSPGFEPATVSDAHSLCRSQVSLLLVRRLPALEPDM